MLNRPNKKRPLARRPRRPSSTNRFRPLVNGLEPRQLLATLIDLNAQEFSYSSDPGSFVELNGSLLFAGSSTIQAYNGTYNDRELWISDGTEAGTSRLADLYAGNTSSNPSELTRVGDSVYFVAENYTGKGLYRTDGTSSGTSLIRNFAGTFGPSQLTAAGDKLYFAANGDSSGTELWVSDGTFGGTERVSDINPGSGSSSPAALTAIGNTVYFAAYESQTSGSRPILWKSDGTPQGTARVPMDASGTPIFLTTSSYRVLYDLEAVGDTLYFTGVDLDAGQELWKTDGTLAGTGRVLDINAGYANSEPSNLTALGNSVLFRANDGTGSAWWSSDGTSGGTVEVGAALPLLDGRLRRGRVHPGPQRDGRDRSVEE